MTPNVTLVAVVACLLAAGFYLLLDRSLTRVLLGILLLGNGANLLLLSSGGPAGGPPILGVTAEEDMADPLPQAMILTAIVITMGMAAFVLAIIYRHWRLTQRDDVVDDVEDRRVATGGVADVEDDGLDESAETVPQDAP
ncbi:MAG TPA: Na(+)/H(+) antiporter subunit C [Mycobacteriales bacterium]|nr:Na(+)/H(+) antiporter subunit C [Mycobacteriales bacterium]